MPAPLDLTGRRFGQLTVLRKAGKVMFGRLDTAWLCRCDCGTEIVVPQLRLPHADYIVRSGHAVYACQQCRARPCIICGKPILPPSTASTCGAPECHREYKRRKYRKDYYRRVEKNPTYGQERSEAVREKAKTDPEYAKKVHKWQKKAQEKKKRRLKTDPEYAEKIRATARERYAKHAAKTLARRKQRFEAMTPEQKQRWMDRARRYGRAYRKKWREELKTNPERHQAYLDLMREYRRRSALTKLLTVGAELIKRSEP